MHFLSVISMFKNETMNLKVWIEHYLWQGVDHFYLIDNGSTDNPQDILNEYIQRGVLTVHYLPHKYQQENLIRRVFDVEKLKERTRWLINCDLDEFFYGVKHKLSSVIKEIHDDKDVVYSHWRMFGSDDLVVHPPDIRTAIVHREEHLRDIQPSKYIYKPLTIKTPLQLKLHSILDENLRDIFSNVTNTDHTNIDNVNIRLNHYPIQSLEFYREVKMSRGDATDPNIDNIRDMNYFYKYDKDATFLDETLKNLVENPPKDY
jgi:hypothetical protein